MAAKNHELVLQRALEKGLIDDDENPLALVVDLDAIKEAVDSLLLSFSGDHFIHCFAVKANPTLSIMEHIFQCGMGFETASIGELRQSLKTAPSGKIVFDSPIKTKREIKEAIDLGVHLNIDNFQEIERVKKIMDVNNKKNHSSKSSYIGIRINPQCGAGTIASHSTATMTSKFGIGLLDSKSEIIAAYKENEWLNGIHVHVGSQGVSIDLAMNGIKVVVELVKEINGILGKTQIQCIDIGGGLSVNFSSEEITPGFPQYATYLKKEVPELFSGEYKVITEFGRSIVAKSGWFASFIEYTKMSGGRNIATQHAGADLCIRTIYHPDKWPLNITVYDSKGKLKNHENLVEHDIAGPCCIAGDIIAHQRVLPLIEARDFIAVHDVGGYYHSSYSRYNCRQSPRVIGYSFPNDQDVPIFKILQDRESVEESLYMFSKYTSI